MDVKEADSSCTRVAPSAASSAPASAPPNCSEVVNLRLPSAAELENVGAQFLRAPPTHRTNARHSPPPLKSVTALITTATEWMTICRGKEALAERQGSASKARWSAARAARRWCAARRARNSAPTASTTTATDAPMKTVGRCPVTRTQTNPRAGVDPGEAEDLAMVAEGRPARTSPRAAIAATVRPAPSTTHQDECTLALWCSPRWPCPPALP